MKQVLLQPAYVLHRRAYRESSFLVELFSKEHGRLSLIAKGVRQTRSPNQALLQPFVPLLISWTGRGELMIITHVEPAREVTSLTGNALFAGFYLNELIIYLLQKWDPHPRLYDRYDETLTILKTASLEEKVLRSFEKHLLEEIGYGLLPKTTISLHNTFAPNKYYRFIPEQGFVESEREGIAEEQHRFLFSGENLLAIANEEWRNEIILQDAKRLIRCVLMPLLGKRPIHARRLFMHQEKVTSQ